MNSNQEKNNHYQSILNAFPESMMVVDVQGMILEFNPAFTAIFRLLMPASHPLESRLTSGTPVYFQDALNFTQRLQHNRAGFGVDLDHGQGIALRDALVGFLILAGGAA